MDLEDRLYCVVHDRHFLRKEANGGNCPSWQGEPVRGCIVGNDLQPYRKRDKPKYMAQEKQFAKKHGMRQTISSGRIGIMKGDAFDSVFVVDNKGTAAWGYTLDVRDWRDFTRRALITHKVPVLQIDFTRNMVSTRVVVMAQEDWEEMRDAVKFWSERPKTTGRPSSTRKRRGQ